MLQENQHLLEMTLLEEDVHTNRKKKNARNNGADTSARQGESDRGQADDTWLRVMRLQTPQVTSLACRLLYFLQVLRVSAEHVTLLSYGSHVGNAASCIQSISQTSERHRRPDGQVCVRNIQLFFKSK